MQHPANGGTHQAGAEPYPPKGMAHYDLTGRQKEPLGWIEHRSICWFLNDMKGFKVGPHRVRRVRHSAVGESIRDQEITKFVVAVGPRQGQKRKEAAAY